MTRLANSVWITLALWLIPFALLAPWLFDRAPPFKVLHAPEPDPVRAGGVVAIVKEVHRDVADRFCDVRFMRYLVDSKGAIFAYDTGYLSATNRALMNKVTGPFVKTMLEIPATASPGRAALYTDLFYSCNPLHHVWPIRVSDHVSFEVLPAH